MQKAKIIGAGVAVPPNILYPSNYLKEIDSEANYGIAESFIAEQLGITEVRRADPGTLPSELAIEAARDLFNRHPFDLTQIDTVIFCGTEGDVYEPSTAHIVAAALGIPANLCFDIQNACLGIGSAIQVAQGFIATGTATNILLVTSEMFGDVINDTIKGIKEDKPGSIENEIGTFTTGDAGGAMLIGPASEGEGLEEVNTKSEPRYNSLCYYKIDNGRWRFSMEMSRISAVTLRLCDSMLEETLGRLGWQREDIDLLITHQVGQKPYERILDMIQAPQAKSIATFPTLGNIASVTLPMCWTIMEDKGMLEKGKKLLMFSSGSGISVSHFGMTL